MAKEVWRDGFVQVQGVDLSSFASTITAESTAEEIDLTSFTTAGYREFGQGFKDATFTVTFFQDFAANSVDATLQPIYDSGGTCSVHFKQHQTATSATNPRYSLGTARMFSYTPFGGGVGDANTFDAVFRNAGTAGMTRGTSGSP
jgi:hypothetical protein